VVQALGALHDTARSKGTRPETLGVGSILQRIPSQRMASVWGTVAPTGGT
jgi:hypothetical protein